MYFRAGHDPAFLYDPAADRFQELAGAGIALGVDDHWRYAQSEYGPWSAGQIVLIGTDGIWEAANPRGERFGKERLRNVVRRCSHTSARRILRAVTEALRDYRQSAALQDDVTLVVVKVREDSAPHRSSGNL